MLVFNCNHEWLDEGRGTAILSKMYLFVGIKTFKCFRLYVAIFFLICFSSLLFKAVIFLARKQIRKYAKEHLGTFFEMVSFVYL